MFTSSGPGLGYRSLQAVCDLRAVARATPSDFAARIAAGTDGVATEDDVLRVIGEGGCVLRTHRDAALHPGLLLAATLPEDPPAFRTATAILLADRLQDGLGQDDLFWHWDAFRNHYACLYDAARAAIFNGFARAQAIGRIALFDPPETDVLTTSPWAHVLSAIVPLQSTEGPIGEAATTLRRVLEGQAPTGEAALLWLRARTRLQELPSSRRDPLLAGLRHIYESRSDFDPFRSQSFDPMADDPPVIPFGSS